MDNYNGQPQYVQNGQQYNPYGYAPYNPQGNMGFYENQVGPQKRKIITVSLVLGLIGSIVLLVGLMMPAIDFSHFHQEIDIQYNLFKIGKNVGIISGMWNIIPYAILISIIMIIGLSFVRIPILKILPVILIICMYVLMLVDMGNLCTWATNLLDKVGIVLEKEITTGEIFKSFMPGIYVQISGLIISIISCFVKISE